VGGKAADPIAGRGPGGFLRVRPGPRYDILSADEVIARLGSRIRFNEDLKGGDAT
jgi:hypothetical protein